MDQESIYNASNQFGLKLLHAFAQDEPTQNIFFSPLSISMCLMLAANGAANQTRHEMLQALCAAGFNLDDINWANQLLLAQLQPPQAERDAARGIIDFVNSATDDKGIADQLVEYFMQRRQGASLLDNDMRFKLTLANSLWVKRGIEFVPAYVAIAAALYDAEADSLDFDDRAAVNTVNDWINRMTHGVIPQIISGFPPEARLVLANAIYFKAFWAKQFSKANTKTKKFTLQSGDQVDCSMMYMQARFSYWEDDDLQMIKLPYESGGSLDLGMVIILPREPQHLDLTLEKWTALLEEIDQQCAQVKLSLPRFSADYTRDLKADLIALGMSKAFSTDADFSALTKSPLWISSVVHKAFIKVDEDGTEAAAVTAVMKVGSARIDPNSIYEMIVDHPFIYAIEDRKSGSLLFIGRTMKPN